MGSGATNFDKWQSYDAEGAVEALERRESERECLRQRVVSLENKRAREEAMRALEQCDVAQRSAAEGWKLAEEAAAEGAPNAVVEPTDHPQPSPPFPPHVSPSPAKRKLAERVCPQVC